MTNKRIENFIGEFDKYNTIRVGLGKHFEIRVVLKNIKDEEDKLVKKHFILDERVVIDGNLFSSLAKNNIPNQLIAFSAEILPSSEYEGGFELINPIINQCKMGVANE